MGNVVGKQFGVVASKDYNTALTESVKEGNQGKFYLTETGGKGFDNITTATNDSRNTLIVNGNKIQGVSTSDINKLNTIGSAITDSGFFKYKRSVGYFSDLPSNPADVRPGDVYNVNTEFELDGVRYPAYTNVVCISTRLDDSSSIKWNALGGTMDIGTHTNISVSTSNYNYIITYKGDGDKPIIDFDIKVKENQGLAVTSNGEIYLNSGQAIASKDEGGLHFNCSTAVINRFSIYCGDGITSEYYGDYGSYGFGLRLATKKHEDLKNSLTRCSGLYIDKNNSLNLALATDIHSTDFFAGIVKIGTDVAEYGGLAIDASVLLGWLESSTDFRNYISSLVSNKQIIIQ